MAQGAQARGEGGGFVEDFEAGVGEGCREGMDWRGWAVRVVAAWGLRRRGIDTWIWGERAERES